ncbi:D-alanyl-D-alanine carboxypeptidase family protein [uncultured Clostridium sp.]|uniref:D-alanyl-D-alanine carboxypeptidase family protein n=1 Tax=uncultured Clostridium sp. TaxID=59620 RepID=UPI0026004B38|nr:D-alanyl-D-alanine carboxypeptidase family protein [uncultured Clostridium sp.]
MKRYLKILSILLFLLCIPLNVLAETSAPDINAQGCSLIDASSGKVLYGKNENSTFEPASTTKVMTAIVVLEKCKLTDEVTVHEDFTAIDGTAIGLLNGDVLTVRDLLLGLIMESGNDCANALAIHVSGSIDSFAQLMNEKAKELGATATSFRNPSGLPDPEHLTTPHDLALFLSAALHNQDFIDISTTQYAEITMINNPERTLIVNNKNYMINKNSRYYYKYALCGKNGYTTKANHTYVSAAEKDGHILVASFLNAMDKNQNFFDMQTVFNYGFDNFSFVKLYDKGQEVAQYDVSRNLTIPLTINRTIEYPVAKGEENSVSYEIKVQDEDLSKKSFNAGENILKGTIYVNNEELETVDLASGVSRTYEPLLSKQTLSNPNVPAYIAFGVAGVAALSAAGIFIKKRLSFKGKH